jgi:uncharacterized membrane protein YadS
VTPTLAAGRTLARQLVPGLAVAALVGMAAAFLGGHYKGSMLLFALLLGMALNFLTEDARLKPGIQFAASTVLRVGVALLGLRLTSTTWRRSAAPPSWRWPWPWPPRSSPAWCWPGCWGRTVTSGC